MPIYRKLCSSSLKNTPAKAPARMNQKIYSPFAKIESSDQARAMQRYSSLAYGLWALMLGVQLSLVLARQGAGAIDGGAMMVVFAAIVVAICAVAALLQWRRPNRILPTFGLGLMLYEFMSLAVGGLVGAPTTIGGLPASSAVVAAVVLAGCILLHIGALRATFARGKFA